MNPMIESVKDALKKYFVFQGRATRPQFWWFELANLIVAVVFTIVIMIAGSVNASLGNLVNTLLHLVTLVVFGLPGISLAVRRLHDIGKSGWWLLLIFIPLIGIIWLIVLWTRPSISGAQPAAQPQN